MSYLRYCMFGSMTAALLMFVGPRLMSAETTAPQKIIYNGHLLSSAGTPVTTQMHVRFSYWTSADKVDADISGTGAINISSATYAGWTEVHTVTPDDNGYFSVELGSVTALPDFSSLSTATLLSLYMQVEVKTASAENTSYELLDRDPDDSTVDRSSVRSVPLALNADLLDRRGIGTGSGSIPLLLSGGLLGNSLIPSGMLGSVFTLDSDDTESSEIKLGFGNSLNKALSYDVVNTRFDFNDDVRVQGDLTVTGLINGIDISTIVSDDNKHLKVSSGAGLTISIANGDYRLKGVHTRYDGDSGVSVSDNVTNYVYFGSGGLTVTGAGFPVDESYISLATVVTLGGAITSVTDRRTFNSDDRERTVERTYAPAFEGAAYVGDGSDNVGQLLIANSGAAISNYYDWSSTRATLQDYDIDVHATLSTEFVSWSDPALQVRYRTTSVDTTKTKLDISVIDTAGTAVTLSGSVTTLANTSWTTVVAEITDGTWTPGSSYIVKLKVSAKDEEHVQIGRITIRNIDVNKE